MKEWTHHIVSHDSLGCSGHDKMDRQASALIAKQRLEWPRLVRGLNNLANARTQTVSDPHGTATVTLIQNSGRYTSASAEPLSDDFCPLCLHNLPDEERGLPMGPLLMALPNPDPIMPNHLIVSHRKHVPQEIDNGLDTLLGLAERLGDSMLAFYNGPSCGASSPFHLHLQIGLRSSLPVVGQAIAHGSVHRHDTKTLTIRAIESFGRRFVLLSTQLKATLREGLIQLMNFLDESKEPPVNLILWTEEKTHCVALFPRGTHRPTCFYLSDPDRILISPGSVEMGGLVVVPRPQDWERVDAETMDQIYREVSVDKTTWYWLLDHLDQIDV